MKIIYGEQLTDSQVNLVKDISLECGITFDTARLLFYRNIDTVEKAKNFLSPGKKGFHNPYDLSNMLQAVERIKKAKELNQSVVIFGDYDADGICALTTLYYCLKEFGIKARLHVPERDDGYGLNLEKVKTILREQPIDLLITVDCGISEAESIEQLKLMGIDVIVTDHHEPPEILPNCIKINPKIKGQKYPFDGLCGAGVAYKLGYALIGEKANKYLDLVATATVADSMDLIEENRDIVVEGLKLFNNPKTLRYQFKCLLQDNNRQVTAQTLSYSIAPKINAGGRMGDACSALKFFISENEKDIFDLAVLLNEYNLARQVECDNIYQQAKAKIIQDKKYKNDVIIVCDSNWKTGFIGIVAAKLVEEYSKPVIVFAGHEGFLKGSARSVDGINIYQAIDAVKDSLIGYGGHAQAAGVSVEKDKIDHFDKAINQYLLQNKISVDTSRKIYADWQIDNEISFRFARELNMLEPFGVGNRKPIFTTSAKSIISEPIKAGSQHYNFKTDYLEMLDFNGEKDVVKLSLPIDKTLLFELDLSVYKGRESLKGYLRSVILDYNDILPLRPYAFASQLDGLLLEQSTYTPIKSSQAFINDNGRVLYAVSDPTTIGRYSCLDKLDRGVFDETIKGNNNVLILSPIGDYSQFAKIVYLDTPISLSHFDIPIYVCSDVCGYLLVEELDVSRDAFKFGYAKLLNLKGKKVIDDVSFINSHFANDFYQMLFVLKVFKELKIFSTDRGSLMHNERIKNELTNSKVYSKICVLKENYV